MNLIEKIRTHGLKQSLVIFSHKIAEATNRIIFITGKIFPINNSLIVIESEGDLTDNSFALFDYMKNNGYLNQYKVIWLVDDVEKAKQNTNFKNTSFASKNRSRIDFIRSFELGRCRWYIYDHNNFMSNVRKKSKQKVVYLSHGWGYKAAKGGSTANDKTHFDILTSTGPLAAKGMVQYWHEPLSKVRITGYPRYDYFFQINNEVKNKLVTKWHIDKYKKIIFWMPTFRQSINPSLSEDYFNNQTGLPIFYTKKDLREFSRFLKRNNILMFFKLHHLQADLPIYKEKFDNIAVVHDEELNNMNIQLYQFVKYADVLISDYSSISIDYLLLDRPIIFTLDDYKQYDKSRGLFPKNAIDYMKGYHVYNKEQLENSISEILSGKDKYQKDRKEVVKKYHTYVDGNSSRRVLDEIGIRKN